MNQGVSALMWFAAIVALIPVALWLLKRTPVGAAASAGNHLRQVAVLPLSPQQRLVTVEVGSGNDRQWLVLGVGPQHITTLHTMAPQAEHDAAAPAPKAAFAQVLQRLRQSSSPDASR